MPEIKKIYSRFLSRKTTILLISILTVLYLLGALIPQRQLLSTENYQIWAAASPVLVGFLEFFSFTTMYSSPLVLCVTALFFLHLVLVNWQRVPLVLREIRLAETAKVDPRTVKAMDHVRLSGVDETTLATMQSLLAARGYLVVTDAGVIKGVKNRYALVGSLIFHLSFIPVLLGTLIIFNTRFSGDTYVAEGQFFSGNATEYRVRRRYSDLRSKLPDVKFQVESFTPTFDGLDALSLKTVLTVTRNGRTSTGVCDVNRPFTRDALSILIADLGAAPLLRIATSDGSDVLEAFAILKIIRGDTDDFSVPGTPYTLRFRMWPDYFMGADGVPLTRTYAFNNPRFEVTVLQDGKPLPGKQFIQSPGDHVSFGSMRLSIPEVRYFGKFVVIEEYGGSVLITGFLLSVAGLMLKVFWRKKTLLGVLDDDGREIIIAYQTEYYSGLRNLELEKLVADVTAACPSLSIVTCY